MVDPYFFIRINFGRIFSKHLKKRISYTTNIKAKIFKDNFSPQFFLKLIFPLGDLSVKFL